MSITDNINKMMNDIFKAAPQYYYSKIITQPVNMESMTIKQLEDCIKAFQDEVTKRKDVVFLLNKNTNKISGPYTRKDCEEFVQSKDGESYEIKEKE